MLLNDFMNDNFPKLELRPALYYSWKIGIRFELGVDYDRDNDYENSLLYKAYIKGLSLYLSPCMLITMICIS